MAQANSPRQLLTLTPPAASYPTPPDVGTDPPGFVFPSLPEPTSPTVAFEFPTLPSTAPTLPTPPAHSWLNTLLGPDPMRSLIVGTGGGLAGAAALPFAAVSPFIPVAAAGLGAQGTGVLYDIVNHYINGVEPPETLLKAGARQLEDFSAGASGQALDPFVQRAVTWIASRVAPGLSAGAQAFRAAAERLGITPMISELRDSPFFQFMEQMPVHLGLTQWPQRQFARQGVGAAEKAVQEEFSRFGGIPNPTMVGQRVREQLASTLGRETGEPLQAAEALIGGQADPMDVLNRAQQSISQAVTEQAGGWGDQLQTMTQQIGRGMDAVALKLRASQDLLQRFGAWKTLKNNAFTQVQTAAGDTPLISLAPVRETAQAMMEEAVRTGTPMPRLVPFLARVGESDADRLVTSFMQDLQGSLGGRDLSPTEMTNFLVRVTGRNLPPDIQAAIAASSETGGMVPFWVARKLESWLGEASGFQKPVGSLAQGGARRLYTAVRGAENDFLLSPAGEATNTLLAEAKQLYRTGLHTFNEGFNEQIMQGRRGGQSMLDRLFKPGNVEELLDYKSIVPEQTWQDTVATWLTQKYRQAMTGQAPDGTAIFSPEAFNKLMRPYQMHDQLSQILTPEQTTVMSDLLRQYATAERTPLYALGKQVANQNLDPESVMGRIFQPRRHRAIQAYRESVPDDVWNDTKTLLKTSWVDNAHTGTSFSRKKYADTILAFDRAGTLDQIFGPVEAQQLREVAIGFDRAARTPLGHLAEMVNSGELRSEQVLPRVFTPGSDEATRVFRQHVSPDLWNESRLSWLYEMFLDSFSEPGGRGVFMPTKYSGRLAEYTNRGQLEMMLAPHPLEQNAAMVELSNGLQNRVNDILDVFPHMKSRETLALGRETLGLWGSILVHRVMNVLPLIAGGGMAYYHHPLAALGTVASTYAMGKAAVSPTVRYLATDFPSQAVRFGAQVAGGALSRAVVPQTLINWPSTPQLPMAVDLTPSTMTPSMQVPSVP